MALAPMDGPRDVWDRRGGIAWLTDGRRATSAEVEELREERAARAPQDVSACRACILCVRACVRASSLRLRPTLVCRRPTIG